MHLTKEVREYLRDLFRTMAWTIGGSIAVYGLDHSNHALVLGGSSFWLLFHALALKLVNKRELRVQR